MPRGGGLLPGYTTDSDADLTDSDADFVSRVIAAIRQGLPPGATSDEIKEAEGAEKPTYDSSTKKMIEEIREARLYEIGQAIATGYLPLVYTIKSDSDFVGRVIAAISQGLPPGATSDEISQRIKERYDESMRKYREKQS